MASRCFRIKEIALLSQYLNKCKFKFYDDIVISFVLSAKCQRKSEIGHQRFLWNRKNEILIWVLEWAKERDFRFFMNHQGEEKRIHPNDLDAYLNQIFSLHGYTQGFHPVVPSLLLPVCLSVSFLVTKLSTLQSVVLISTSKLFLYKAE